MSAALFLAAVALAADPDPIVEQHAKAAIAEAIATTRTILDVEEFRMRGHLESTRAAIKRADNAKVRGISERNAAKIEARLKGLRVANSRVILTPFMSPGFLAVGDCGEFPAFLGESNVRVLALRPPRGFDGELIDRVTGRSNLVRFESAQVGGATVGQPHEIDGLYRVASEDRTGPRPVFVLEPIDLTPFLPTGFRLAKSFE